MKASILAFFLSVILIMLVPTVGQAWVNLAALFLLIGSIGVFVSLVGLTFSMMFWSVKHS